MDIGTAIHNGALEVAAGVLTSDDILEVGAATFEATPGSTGTKLASAIAMMCDLARIRVEPLALPADLDSLHVPQLARLARDNDVFVPSGTRKTDIIRSLRSAQRRSS